MNVASADDLSDLLLRVGAGDRTAFGRLYDLSSPHLFAVALRICRKRSMAEDVLQETYVRVWNNARQYQPDRGVPLAWMSRIVRNLAIDNLRRAGASAPPSTEVPEETSTDPSDDPMLQTIKNEEASVVRKCLDQLEKIQKTSIMLAFYQGLTHIEVGDRLKLPLGTVKSHIRRGLQRLKNCIGP